MLVIHTRWLYLFSASAFNIVGGVAQPKAVVELIRFNGDGTLTGGPATASINGTIVRSPAGGLGDGRQAVTLSVAACCQAGSARALSMGSSNALDHAMD